MHSIEKTNNLFEVTRESLGVSPLKTALNVLGVWPIVSKSGSFDEKAYDWKESLATVIAHFGYNPIFTFDVTPDANDTKVNRFTVSHNIYIYLYICVRVNCNKCQLMQLV